jgi:general stress protein 26
MPRVATFSELEQAFVERAHAVVWCNVATVDTHNRPRSRVLHPIWEGQTGWIATGRNSLKGRHLAHSPFVSLAYVADPLRPIYVECRAAWDDTSATKERIWNLFSRTPPPLGYDLAPFFGTVDSPEYGVLQLAPWRVELANLFEPHNAKVWQA